METLIPHYRNNYALFFARVISLGNVGKLSNGGEKKQDRNGPWILKFQLVLPIEKGNRILKNQHA